MNSPWCLFGLSQLGSEDSDKALIIQAPQWAVLLPNTIFSGCTLLLLCVGMLIQGISAVTLTCRLQWELEWCDLKIRLVVMNPCRQNFKATNVYWLGLYQRGIKTMYIHSKYHLISWMTLRVQWIVYCRYSNYTILFPKGIKHCLYIYMCLKKIQTIHFTHSHRNAKTSQAISKNVVLPVLIFYIYIFNSVILMLTKKVGKSCNVDWKIKSWVKSHYQQQTDSVYKTFEEEQHTLQCLTMTCPEYIHYHNLLLPPEAHSLESLEFAQNFSVQDTDVFAVTYPKSGAVLFCCS